MEVGVGLVGESKRPVEEQGCWVCFVVPKGVEQML